MKEFQESYLCLAMIHLHDVHEIPILDSREVSPLQLKPLNKICAQASFDWIA